MNSNPRRAARPLQTGAGRQQPPRPAGRRNARPGTLYIAVLGVTMIVATLALASATVGRLELRRGLTRVDQQQARALALDAVEYGFNWIQKHPDWREKLTSGEELQPFDAEGPGWFGFVATDPDGDLADDPEGGFVLRGVGRSGDAVACEEVEVAFVGKPMGCLRSALHVEESLDVPSGTPPSWRYIYGDGEVSSGGAIEGGGAFSGIYCDAWAVENIDAQVFGRVSEWQSPPRAAPGEEVFDHYIAIGTPIRIEDIPSSGGARRIEKQLISAAVNPYGPADPSGVYVIDCQGEDLVLDTGRIVATIVLLNNGPGSEVTGAVCWEPPGDGQPALLSQGDLRLSTLSYGPNEFFTRVNYNPPGTPYDGRVDDDKLDLLAPRLWGVFYVGGTLTVEQSFGPVTTGVVVCAEYALGSVVTHNYDPAPLANPPPGFRLGGELRIVPGSWRSVAR